MLKPALTRPEDWSRQLVRLSDPDDPGAPWGMSAFPQDGCMRLLCLCFGSHISYSGRCIGTARIDEHGALGRSAIPAGAPDPWARLSPGSPANAAHARASARTCSLGKEDGVTSSRVCLPPSSFTNESSQPLSRALVEEILMVLCSRKSVTDT
jgi:hypothetical protein